jgi:hypothetical protein
MGDSREEGCDSKFVRSPERREIVAGHSMNLLSCSSLIGFLSTNLSPFVSNIQLPELSWLAYRQSAPYCLLVPAGVATPPRTAGFGNRDRLRIEWQDWLHSVAAFHCNQQRNHNVAATAILWFKSQDM